MNIQKRKLSLLARWAIWTIVLLVLGIWAAYSWNEDDPVDVALASIVFGSLFCTISFALGASMIACFEQGGALVRDGKIIHVFDWPYDCYLSEYRRIVGDGEYIAPNGSRMEVEMELQPITENPKVRKLLYSLQVSFNQTPQAVVRLRALLEAWKTRGVEDMNGLLKYVCYEMNEKHSKELAKFYNPQDVHQQARFGDIVISFFRETFGGDMPFSLEKVSFTL